MKIAKFSTSAERVERPININEATVKKEIFSAKILEINTLTYFPVLHKLTEIFGQDSVVLKDKEFKWKRIITTMHCKVSRNSELFIY